MADQDPWARFQDAPQPQPSDGGDLSGPTARRLPGERAVAPRGTALQGPGELEDPEAAAYARSDAPVPDAAYQKRLMDQINHGRWYNAEGAKGAGAVVAAPFVAAKHLYDAALNSGEQLKEHGYVPGSDYAREHAAEDAFNVASVAGTGGFAGSRAVADTGSLGVFIARTGAENMAKAGRPTALKALDMAERMDARGIPEKGIREATNAVIEAEDAKLGGVHKGEDGKWRVELDDSQARFRQAGPQSSRVARELDYPDLYLAHPDLMQRRIDRQPGSDSYYFPDEDSFLIGQGSTSRKAAMLHEVEHAVSKRNDLAPGASQADFEDGARGAHLRLPGETPRQAYNRVLGEQYAFATEARRDYSAAQRRSIDPRLTIEKRRQGMGLEDRTINVEEHGRAQSIGRDPLAPGEPSAFEQASEGHWDDLSQRGEAIDRAKWAETVGARPNKAPVDKTRTQYAAEQMEGVGREAAKIEREMTRNGEAPQAIADVLNTRLGLGVDANAISNKQAWWHADTPKGRDWSPSEVAELSRLYADGASYADISKRIEAFSGRKLATSSVPMMLAAKGIARNRTGLWTRDANLDLAQLHNDGKWPADIAARLKEKYSLPYTEDKVATQLQDLRIIGRKKPPAGDEWQPDATAILKSDRIDGMTTPQIARLIEEETGQVTTKNAVIGKMNRMRQERQRTELEEDLAKSGIKLRAAGVPISGGDAPEKRRKSWPILDRINFWGGY